MIASGSQKARTMIPSHIVMLAVMAELVQFSWTEQTSVPICMTVPKMTIIAFVRTTTVSSEADLSRSGWISFRQCTSADNPRSTIAISPPITEKRMMPPGESAAIIGVWQPSVAEDKLSL